MSRQDVIISQSQLCHTDNLSHPVHRNYAPLQLNYGYPVQRNRRPVQLNYRLDPSSEKC